MNCVTADIQNSWTTFTRQEAKHKKTLALCKDLICLCVCVSYPTCCTVVSLHILQVGRNEFTPVYKLSLMEYGTASNLSPARQNHIIDPGSSTDASNKIICFVYQAWLLPRLASGLHYKYYSLFRFLAFVHHFLPLIHRI